jgi:hypothetical protein
MTTFELTCAQNEYLSPGATQVDAIVTVTRHCTEGAIEPPSGPRAELIIVDVSGSMGGRKIKEAARAAAAAVDCIEDGVRFALIAGSHDARRLHPSVPGLRLAVSSPDTRAEARNAVASLRASGGTNIGAWISLATGLIAEQEGLNHAILLTDGQNDSGKADELTRALDEAARRFQCDCRGVGSDWSVPELRRIATALLGTVDIVADPDDLAADFTALMRQSMGREVGNVDLRLSTPMGATVTFVKQVFPEIVDLSDRGTAVNERATDYPTGAWGCEARDYHVSLHVNPGAVGDEMLAGRVTLMTDGEDGGQALIRAIWTDDTAQSTRINPRIAEYTDQAELAALVDDGLNALKAGDLDTATAKLGPAWRRAQEVGNDDLAARLSKVVEVEDEATGKVRLKRNIDAVAQMEAEVGSTKTKRVKR